MKMNFIFDTIIYNMKMSFRLVIDNICMIYGSRKEENCRFIREEDMSASRQKQTFWPTKMKKMQK